MSPGRALEHLLDLRATPWLLHGMPPTPHRPLGPFLLFATLLYVSLDGGALMAREPSAREKTIERLAQLRNDKTRLGLVEEPIFRAEEALAKAQAMRDARDLHHAELREELAREWVELGFDVLAARQAESNAEALERSVLDTQTKLIRGRALLEQTVARRGRALHGLQELGPKPLPPSPNQGSRP